MFASNARPTDAHDAGGLGSLRPKCAQLKLMMLAVRGSLRPKCAQLMLMMLALSDICVQKAPS